LYSATKGLKYSNYVIGHLEFAPARVASILNSNAFDCALFEYWHAARSTYVFRERGIPCVLDMHNILWQAYERDLNNAQFLPGLWNRRTLRKYQEQEEQAWENFDGLITINSEEHKYVENSVATRPRLFYAPMGTDLCLWPYLWQPVSPLRIAYYGGLSSPHNQRDALRCYEKIMPKVWSHFPDAELWLIGSKPPEFLRALATNPRVRVTGFVEDAQSLLSTMTMVLCPWTGTYGFRSRLIEVMAIGVPLVASHDAVYGMELEHGKDLLLGTSDDELAGHSLRLLNDEPSARQQSQHARHTVERLYSIGNTYDRLMRELTAWMFETDRKIA
jgi:glycosyltransferase involved in cell wall biosynthesis